MSRHWQPTGAVRLRRGFFGLLRVEIEQRRIVDRRPIGAGYSPGFYEAEYRWIRMPRGESFWMSGPVQYEEPERTPPPSPRKI